MKYVETRPRFRSPYKMFASTREPWQGRFFPFSDYGEVLGGGSTKTTAASNTDAAVFLANSNLGYCPEELRWVEARFLLLGVLLVYFFFFFFKKMASIRTFSCTIRRLTTTCEYASRFDSNNHVHEVGNLFEFKTSLDLAGSWMAPMKERCIKAYKGSESLKQSSATRSIAGLWL